MRQGLKCAQTECGTEPALDAFKQAAGMLLRAEGSAAKALRREAGQWAPDRLQSAADSLAATLYGV